MQKNNKNAPIYKLEDFQYAPDTTPQPSAQPSAPLPVEEDHPWYKKALCGDNPLGNIFYPIWRDLECPCCSFWRGFLTSFIVTTPVLSFLIWVF
jgi:hypothetical protein